MYHGGCPDLEGQLIYSHACPCSGTVEVSDVIGWKSGCWAELRLFANKVVDWSGVGPKFGSKSRSQMVEKAGQSSIGRVYVDKAAKTKAISQSSNNFMEQCHTVRIAHTHPSLRLPKIENPSFQSPSN